MTWVSSMGDVHCSDVGLKKIGFNLFSRSWSMVTPDGPLSESQNADVNLSLAAHV